METIEVIRRVYAEKPLNKFTELDRVWSILRLLGKVEESDYPEELGELLDEIEEETEPKEQTSGTSDILKQFGQVFESFSELPADDSMNRIGNKVFGEEFTNNFGKNMSEIFGAVGNGGGFADILSKITNKK